MQGEMQMNDEKFEKIYNELVSKNKNELERDRKLAQKEMIHRNLITILAFFVTLALIYIIFKFILKKLGLFEIILLFTIIMFFEIYIYRITKKMTTKKNKYNQKYKQNVIYPLIKSFNQDFVYSPNLRYTS